MNVRQLPGLSLFAVLVGPTLKLCGPNLNLAILLHETFIYEIAPQTSCTEMGKIKVFFGFFLTI